MNGATENDSEDVTAVPNSESAQEHNSPTKAVEAHASSARETVDVEVHAMGSDGLKVVTHKLGASEALETSFFFPDFLHFFTVFF